MSVLDAIPAKNPYVKKSWKGNTLCLTRDRSLTGSIFLRLLIKLRQIPRFKRVDIEDELGIRVWELCNGDNTIQDISSILMEDFKNSEEMKDSDEAQVQAWVVEFMKKLYSSRVIYYKRE
ncbi:MAG: PqqD family protein [Candidatus Methanofastidiosia archaeon]